MNPAWMFVNVILFLLPVSHGDCPREWQGTGVVDLVLVRPDVVEGLPVLPVPLGSRVARKEMEEYRESVSAHEYR